METLPAPAGRRLFGVLADREGVDVSPESPGPVSLQSVGRNPVWRIGGLQQIYFCKYCENTADLRREASGYRIAQELAGTNPHAFVAAEIVDCDEESRLLVTTELPGIPASQFIKESYRMDRNPFYRRAARDRAKRAIELVCAWLREFHKTRLDAGDDLYDHSTAGVRARINDVLARNHNGANMKDTLDIPLLDPLSAGPSGGAQLTFGDCTLGNFLLAGDRIGATDFEDIGIGPSVRDFSVLRSGIEDGLRNPYYYSDSQLLESIYQSGRSPFELLLRVEQRVLKYEQWLITGRLKGLRKLRAANDLRRAISNLHECAQRSDR